jgi:DNA-binding response OmpR family regulator
VSKRILVVDDEPGIVDLVSYGLRREGYDVEAATDGEEALRRAREAVYDLIVLDVMLPGVSGMDVCRMLRSEGDVPILILTARDAEVDTVVGLEIGADDYVTKPFSMAELVSRVRAILRRRELDRSAAAGGVVREVGGIRVDLARHEVLVDGEAVGLTPSEYRLLTLLMNEPHRVFTRRQIMQHLWDSAWVAEERTCDAHISNLRRKLGPAADRIATVRGVGYKLAV